MTDLSRDAIINVISKGIRRDIDVALEHECYRGTLILIYSGIDTMAYLAMPPSKTKVTRQHFVDWVDRYVKFPCKEQVSGLEVYAARCGLVHTYSSDSDLTKAGKCRKIGYADKMIPEIKSSGPQLLDLVIVSIDGLRTAFFAGIDAFLVDVFANPQRSAAAEGRLHDLLHLFPFDHLEKKDSGLAPDTR